MAASITSSARSLGLHAKIGEELLEAIGGATFGIVESRHCEWASASFRGTRHEFVIMPAHRLAPAAVADAQARLAAYDFRLGDVLIADASLSGLDDRPGQLRAEALAVLVT